MEKWDVYTQNREKTEKVIERGQKLSENEYRLTVHACIFNNKGQLLIQQRQPFKKGWANMWDITVGGCALTGETSQQAITRELYEELGYEMDFTGVRPQLTVNFDGGFDDIYLIQLDNTIDTDELKLQYEEVQCVRWASLREIEEMIHRGVFIPYYENLIKLMFDMRGTYGCFQKDKIIPKISIA